MRKAILTAVSLSLLLSTAVVAAPKNDEAPPAFRLAKIFTDNMVLQQDKPVRVWGFAPAGTKVSVTLTQDPLVGRNAEADAGIERADPTPRRGQDGEARDVTVQYVENAPPAPVNQRVYATAGDGGTWCAEFKPAKGSFRPTWIIASGGDKPLVLRNVLIGEVWLCAGQSNMGWSNFNRKDREAASADFPGLRYVAWHDSWYKPLDDVRNDLNWRPCTPANVRSFSAVPYLYGMFLHRYLKVPVGIINVARGGTLGQTWCMRDELDDIDNVLMKTVLKDYDAECATWDDPKQVEQIMAEWKKACADAEKKYERDVAKYKEDLAKYNAGDKSGRPPRQPRKRLPKQPGDVRSGWSPPAGLFNATVMPIRKLSLRGVLYYQGENQAFGLWTRYEYTFPRIPVSMRKAFGDDGLWFGCISQPGWGQFGTDPEVSAVRGQYQVVRDVQRRALKGDKLAGMIATYPTGNSYIHPAEKLPVAEYASLWALANAYEKPVVHVGFRYREHEVRDGKIYLYFDIDPVVYDQWKHLEKNAYWQVLPCPYQGNAPFEGFTIAGADRRWYPAKGRHVLLDKKHWTIELSSDLCPEPVAARYGWANWPTGNLVGRGNLPLPTFRTDDWPLPETYRYSDEARKKADEVNAANLLTAQKQALDRKIRQALIDLPKLEQELYLSKLQRDEPKLIASKVNRAAAAIGELTEDRGPLSRTIQGNPELAKKLQAAQKALAELKAEAAKIEP